MEIYTPTLEGSFKSADKKHDIAYSIWEPKSRPRAIVQVSHGMCEYVGRYADFARFLNKNGIILAGNDHLGHGRSVTDASELGYLGEKSATSVLVDDLAAMSACLRERYPELPIILLGHSMGSFVARLYLSRYAENISGAIIMGTAGPGAPTGMGKLVINTVSLFRGMKYRSPFVKKLAFSGYLKRCGKDAHPSAWLSRDKDVVLRYSDDPCCNYTFTLSGYYTLFSLLEAANSPEWKEHIPTDLPILLISGADDPVGGYGKGVGEVAKQIKSAAVRDLRVLLYPEARHEVLNEINREEVYADLLEWITHALEAKAENSDGADGE